MPAAWRHLLRMRGKLRRATETVSTTGATTYAYADLSATAFACFVSAGRGRMRKDDSGQYSGKAYTVLFGSEAAPRQNDILVVTHPPGFGEFRLVHVNPVHEMGLVNHFECEAESYLPAGEA